GFSERSSDLYSLKVQHEFPNGGELTSVTAYYKTYSDWEMDSAGVPQVNVVDDILDRTDAFTQEIRYAQDISDNFDILAGIFYLNEETDREEFFRFVNFFGDGIDDRSAVRPATDPDDAVGGYRQINETNSIAGFVHGNYDFWDRFSLSAGVRVTYDEKEIVSSGFASGEDPTVPGLPGFIINETFGNIVTGEGIADSADFTNVSPKASINFQATDDVLIYASYSRGFKSGGFGAAPPNADAAANIGIDPETANSYEIGLKGQFFDNTMRFNVAGFYLDYQDLQFQRFGPSLIADATAPDGFTVDPTSFGFFSTINAGDADVFGVEAELTWRPIEGLTLDANYAFLDTEAEINFRDFFTDDPGQDFIINQELNRAPRNKFAVSALYQHPVGDNLGELLWSVDFRYSESRRADFVDDNTIEDAFGLVDANLTWVSPNEQWQFSVWGKNLTDDRYFSHVYVIGPGQIGTLGEPRMYGGAITWSYN
ncbi:MAG: TonB-dependent receptor, partial [Pseudomonadota bacterium]